MLISLNCSLGQKVKTWGHILQFKILHFPCTPHTILNEVCIMMTIPDGITFWLPFHRLVSEYLQIQFLGAKHHKIELHKKCYNLYSNIFANILCPWAGAYHILNQQSASMNTFTCYSCKEINNIGENVSL